MISGATYRDGAASLDGAVYIHGLQSSESVPVAAQGKGSKVSPPGFRVTADGAIYVRFA